MKKTICIVSCFDCYQGRTKFIEKYYMKKGYDVIHIISDFSHAKKEYIKETRKNVILLHVPAYQKNLSLQRINSHRVFAKKSYAKLKEMRPDMIYCNIPPNFMTKWMARYREENPDITLVFDIYDLWPETMISGKKNPILKIPFSVWKSLRDKNINTADYIFTECNLYQQVLESILEKKKTSTLYVTKESTGLELMPMDSMNEINLCYLGSINNIIDISGICNLIAKIQKKKPVSLHIIGIGEKKGEFIKKAQEAGAKVEDYGAIYDDVKKNEIFSKCHFGLNMMKETVCVGLTLKSLNYFEAGLPVINNIKADTYELVKKYGAGVNIAEGTSEMQITKMEIEEYTQMRMNTRRMFLKVLSEERLMKCLNERKI